MVRAPTSFAISATTGAAPVPVPPPIPAAINTMSQPFKRSYRSSRDSCAASRPMEGSPPTPRPRARRSPILTFSGTSRCIRCCASVFIATYSTPGILCLYILVTALDPPPPTPMTLIRATPIGSCEI